MPGDFKGQSGAVGLGLGLADVPPLSGGKAQLLSKVKCLPELDTDKRLEGDKVWFKLGILL